MTKQYPISNEKFSQAKNLITKNGGRINADNTFEIQGVKGHFERGDNTITITVTRKPFFGELVAYRRETEWLFQPGLI